MNVTMTCHGHGQERSRTRSAVTLWHGLSHSGVSKRKETKIFTVKMLVFVHMICV